MWGFAAPIDAERGIVVPADRRSGGQLLRRRSSGQQRVRQFDRRGRCGDRQVQVALPDRASRSSGTSDMPSAGALVDIDAERPTGRRRSRTSARRATSSSSNRANGKPLIRRRGAAGAEGRRAGRVVFADAAVPGAARRRSSRVELQQGDRHGAAGRHDGRARGGVPGA